MSITAIVENGTIKLPEGVHLPDGTTVKIEAVTEPEGQPSGKTFAERFAKYIGVVDDMPADLAENIDHYLYGAPKRTK